MFVLLVMDGEFCEIVTPEPVTRAEALELVAGIAFDVVFLLLPVPAEGGVDAG